MAAVAESAGSIKMEAKRSSSNSASAAASEGAKSVNININNNNNNSSCGKAVGLPSFSELLWCPDVDGDVMTQGIGGAMVRNTKKHTAEKEGKDPDVVEKQLLNEEMSEKEWNGISSIFKG